MENQQRIIIDLFEKDALYPWGNIIDTNNRTLIGMYEEGKVARKLFWINKTQLRQLVNTLQMLIKD